MLVGGVLNLGDVNRFHAGRQNASEVEETSAYIYRYSSYTVGTSGNNEFMEKKTERYDFLHILKNFYLENLKNINTHFLLIQLSRISRNVALG